MNNPIEDMRERLSERFRGARKPLKGLRIISPTANNTPRMPQSNLPRTKDRHDRVGQPSKSETRLPENKPFRKKPRDIFGGWL